MGIDRLVLGSDYTYLRRDLAVSCRERIETSSELTETEKTVVLGGTAATLIPRPAALDPQTQAPASRATSCPES